MKKCAITLLLFLSIPTFAQEIPRAVQVDQFGKIPCGDLFARIDNFQNQLSMDPTSTGVVIITPQKDSQNKAQTYKKLIEGALQRREFDLARLKIYRTADSDSFGGSFWLLPAGAELPKTDLQQWPRKILDLSKPFIFDSESDVLICETFAPKVYAELIKKNPQLRGHIVVHPHSRRYQREISKKWLETFTSLYKVPRKRLRFFYAEETDPGYVEFWIVPIRKK